MLPKAAGLQHAVEDKNVIDEDTVIIGGTRIFGVDAEAYRKIEAKRDRELERQIAQWIAEVTKEPVDLEDPIESLRSGVLLCKLLNAIRPGVISKYNTRTIPLLEMV